MKGLTKTGEAFFKNPIAWIVCALLALVVYGNYERGRDLDRVCELLGPHDVVVPSPQTPRQEIDNICISRLPDEQ
jgi:hypothetical protein